MLVPINYIAVLGAAAASMALGALWYGPLFGKQWVRLSGMTPEHIEEARQRGMAKLYVLAFVGSLVMAYILAHVIAFAEAYYNQIVYIQAPPPSPFGEVSGGLMAGFWSWLGFIAPVTLGTVLWDNKPWSLWVLNNAYQLLALLTMGVILALWS